MDLRPVTSRSIPLQKPGHSRQDHSTPKVFLDAVKKRFGFKEFAWDLAAHEHNHVCANWIGPGSKKATDSLTYDWTKLQGELWLNPPFGRIEPWAELCAATNLNGGRIFFLAPASVGANWYARHVHGEAHVFFLNGRLSFDGIAPYPKDCLLACYGPKPGYEVWRWRDALGKNL